MRRPRGTVESSHSISSWGTPFQFARETHSKLVRLLGLHIVDVDVVVSLLEARTNSYLLVRPSKSRPRSEFRALQAAARDVSSRLTALGEDATDLLLDALTIYGYDASFIQRLLEGLHLLGDAIDRADGELPPPQGGRPPESTRKWFLREVCLTLEKDGGIDVRSRAGARALSQCIRIILGSIGEPVPCDMRPLLNEARSRT